MSLFGKLVSTAINIATLPIAIVEDVVTLGGTATDHESYIAEKLRQIKEEAQEDIQ